MRFNIFSTDLLNEINEDKLSPDDLQRMMAQGLLEEDGSIMNGMSVYEHPNGFNLSDKETPLAEKDVDSLCKEIGISLMAIA